MWAWSFADSAACADTPTATAAAVEQEQVDGMRVRLKDGSFSRGRVVPLSSDGRIGWLSPGFAEPFELDVAAIRSISRISDEELTDETPATGQMFELVGGAMVVGQLREMGPHWLTIRTPLLGMVEVDRSQVAAIVDAGYAGKLVYSGPVDDERWQRLSAVEDWQFEAGALVANKPGATIVGNVQLPSKCQVNLSLSWRGAPDFVLSLGTLASNLVSKVEEVPSAARLEVWDKQLAVVREVDTGADIAMLSELSDVNPRLDLSIYLDQEAGTVVVCDAHGRPLETVQMPAEREISRPSVHLANHGETLAVERFEVREWDGVASTLTSAAEQRVLTESGESIEGQIVGFEPAEGGDSGDLLIRTPEGTQLRLPLAQLRRGEVAATDAATSSSAKQQAAGLVVDQALPPPVVQPPPLEQSLQADPQATDTDAREAQENSDNFNDLFAATDAEPAPPPAATARPIAKEVDAQPAGLELVLLDRTRLKGRWLAARTSEENPIGELRFEAMGLREPVQFSARIIRGLIGSPERFPINPDTPRQGTLKMNDSQLAGFLLPNSPAETATGLHWQPLGSLTASPIALSASGAIVYRQALPKVTVGEPAEAGNARIRVLAPAVGMFLGNKPRADSSSNAGSDVGQNASDVPAAGEILFRTGDAIDGTVERIDEEGMTFRSTQSKTTFVRHEQIQQVWLNPQRGSVNVTPEKMKRLMTVPRSMKQDPPTHLFISVNGDYLRGRLVSMENSTISVEIRLELTEIPLSSVSQIVWLHDRDWNETKAADDPAVDPQSAFSVHAIASTDRGLTFQPEQVVDGVLSGTSELLGACSVELDKLNQLLFGRDIVDEIRQYRDDPWTLSLAQYPRVYLEEESGGAGAAGTTSALVGQEAPDFLLKSLDDEAFRLSRQRDRVVVLDFWASWCGPCIQTMPLVEEVVDEFGADKVNLVAVNIQEAATRVQVAVDRLELSATVLLDTDGQTAAVYGANAIPQTVIIDREGKVTHVFVGGGPKFVAQFRQALQGLLE